MAPISVLTDDNKIAPAWLDFLNKAIDLASDSITTTASEYSCTSNRFWGANFSSANNQSVFGNATAILNTAGRGLLMSANSLNPSAKPELQGSGGVFQAFRVNDTLNDFVKNIRGIFKDGTFVELDTSPRLDGVQARNGIWLLPGSKDGIDLQVTTSLSFKFSHDFTGSLRGMGQLLSDEFGLSLGDSFESASDVLQSFSITVQQTTYGVVTGDSQASVSSRDFHFIVRIPIKGFDFYIKCGSDGVQLNLRESTNTTGTLWARISDLVSGGNSAPSQADAEPVWDNVFNALSLHLWYITIGITSGKVSWKVAFVLDWMVSDQPISLALAYDSTNEGSKPNFNGNLLLKGDFNSDPLLPSFDVIFDAPPAIVLPKLELSTFFPAFKTVPKGIPTEITTATLDFSKTTHELHLQATITQKKDPPSGSEVPAPFTWDVVTVTVTKGTNGTGFHIGSSFKLNPPQPDTENFGTGTLVIEADYTNGDWEVHGSTKGIHFEVLTDFLDSTHRNALLNVLGKLSIKSLNVDYNYRAESGGQSSASSFLFAAVIDCGQLELQMFYQYVSSEVKDKSDTAAQKIKDKIANENPDEKPLYDKLTPLTATGSKPAWKFEAYLGSNKHGATIGSVIDSIVPNSSGSIPTFAKVVEVDPASGDTSPITLAVNKPGNDADEIIFTLDVFISSVEFTFVQISGNEATSAKRVLQISVAKIPLLDNLPVVQELPQPFQKLVYLWVTGQDPLMQDQVDEINGQLGESSKVSYKSNTNPAKDDNGNPTEDAASHAANNPVLVAGHHFIVIEDNKVVLDHVFNNVNTQSSPPSTNSAALISAGLVMQEASPPPAEEEPSPTKGSLNKTTKFLSISGVSLQYKNEALWIMMDATVTLGPISLSLLGFGIGLKITNLTKLKNISPLFDLHGMAVSFDNPPLTIAGVFEHEVLELTGETQDAYRGGIAVGFPPYTFVAVGEYAKVTVKKDNLKTDYKSIFIYAKLNGPLISLEFATISGVRLGFGYNSVVRSPSMEELNSFPLINDSGSDGAGNNPMKILQSLRGGDNPWINVKDNAYWFAVGMTVDSFDILSITAVALVGFRDAGLVISIFADAIAQLPPNASKTDSSSFVIMYVEIDMVAEMNFVDQYFRVEASLAPTSFLLVPQCHLYGGFALCYWFGNNPHAGDWVFSIGGYHRSFIIPDHYPRPKRLGISFRIGDNMSITGETYFAITPKCVMGGAMIHVQLSVGPVSAYLDTSFDALINFHPVHYIIDLRIAVGVECDIDILFIHGHISIHIGADLHVEGPEFGGTAHVDFWFFGFDVSFGSYNEIPPPLSLIEFFDLVHKAGPVSDQPAKDQAPSDVIVDLKFALEEGAFPMQTKDKNTDPAATGSNDPESTGVGALWYVKGGSFRFRIACDFAVSEASLETTASASAPKDDHGNETTEGRAQRAMVPTVTGLAPIYSTPMHLTTTIQSPLEISIKNVERNEIIDNWHASFIVKPVPVALWGYYDESKDPMRNKPKDLLNADGATTPLCMGVTLAAPPPRLAIAKIPAFNATEMAKRPVQDPMAIKNSETDPQGNKFTPWWWTLLFPDPVTQNNMLPKPLDPPEATALKDWEKMQKRWEDACTDNAEVAAEAAKACMSILGWDKPAPETVQKAEGVSPKPWELKTGLPKRLVTGTKDTKGNVKDGLENLYLALPRLVKV